MRDIAMHILDIVGNSIRAHASNIEISVQEDLDYDVFSVSIKDDGDGMSKETIKKAMDPFFTSRNTRKVGLGIPLLQQNAELANGGITIQSELGIGTSIKAVFVRSHIDKPPLGDMADTIGLLMSGNPSVEFIYKHTINNESYELSTKELKKTLDNIPINNPKINRFIKQMIEENLELIGVEL